MRVSSQGHQHDKLRSVDDSLSLSPLLVLTYEAGRCKLHLHVRGRYQYSSSGMTSDDGYSLHGLRLTMRSHVLLSTNSDH